MDALFSSSRTVTAAVRVFETALIGSALVLVFLMFAGCGIGVAGLTARVEIRAVGDSAVCAVATLVTDDGDAIFELPPACYSYRSPASGLAGRSDPAAATSPSAVRPRSGTIVAVATGRPVRIDPPAGAPGADPDTISAGRVFGPPNDRRK